MIHLLPRCIRRAVLALLIAIANAAPAADRLEQFAQQIPLSVTEGVAHNLAWLLPHAESFTGKRMDEMLEILRGLFGEVTLRIAGTGGRLLQITRQRVEPGDLRLGALLASARPRHEGKRCE